MRVIPDVLLKTTRDAEKRVFNALKSVDWGNDWCAYHSLNCSEHAYKRWAEIDFLILGPECALVLEVKGGAVSYQDGIWTWGESRSAEGPFKQAASAMFGLQKKILIEKYNFAPAIRDTMCFGFGVVFPHVAWNFDSPEMPREIVADLHAFQGGVGFEKYLRRLKAYWLSKASRAVPLTTPELRELRAKLRPDIDVYPPYSVNVGMALDEICSLTDEQYSLLDVIDGNDRIAVTGGAGTGKTFLMMQCARRERALGRRVLVVVDSPILAAHLGRLDASPGITFATIDRLDGLGPFEVLLVDEGQDILDLESLSALGEVLPGGLDFGRWRWFMDENNQSHVSGRYQESAYEFLMSGLVSGPPVRVSLQKNVRTTRNVAERIQEWTGADIGIAQFSGYGEPPELVIVEDEGELVQKVEEVLGRLLDEVNPSDIGLVVADELNVEWIAKLAVRLKKRLVPLGVETICSDLRNMILWGSPAKFKGLEKPVIVAVGFSGEAFVADRVSELYVALSRCNYGLWLFVDSGLRQALAANEAQFGQLDRG